MAHSAATKHVDEVHLAITRIESQDPGAVVQGLNVLTRKSFDALEANNVQFEHFPQLLVSLGSLLDIVNPLKDLVFSSDDSADITEFQTSWERWKSRNNCSIKVDMHDLMGELQYFNCTLSYAQALSYNMDDNVMLLTVLNILRNLSFDIVNEQIMGASASFLQHLASIILLTLESGVVSQATHLAMETLINIAGRIDLTGKRRLQGFFFSEDTLRLKSSTETVQRNLLKLRMCRDLSTASYGIYMSAVTALTSAIASIICADSVVDRTLTLRAVELLGRIGSNTDNGPYLAGCPQELLDGLVQLLASSASFTEPLVPDTYQINGDPLGRHRPPAAVHLTSRALAAAVGVPPVAGGGSSSAPYAAANAAASALSTGPTPAPGGADSAVTITFNGIRADCIGFYASGPSVFGSSSNLVGLSSHSSSSALAQRATPGPGAAPTAAPIPVTVSAQSNALLTSMTPVAPYFVDGCDQEMRDTVIDALHAIALPAAPLQPRLAQQPRLVQFLLRIARCYNHYNPAGGVPGLAIGAATAVGGGGGSASNLAAAGGVHRTEAMIKALQILSALLAQPEGSRAFLALQTEFLGAACSDDFIAEVVCNKALPVQQELKARQAYSLLQQQQQVELQLGADGF